MFRTDTFASSPLPRTIFTNSRRRSSVSSGMTTRMSVPSFEGVPPRFGAVAMARSMSFSAVLSYGVTTSIRASGACSAASCPSGVGVP